MKIRAQQPNLKRNPFEDESLRDGSETETSRAIGFQAGPTGGLANQKMGAAMILAFFPTGLLDGPIDIRGLGWMVLDLIDEICDTFTLIYGYGQEPVGGRLAYGRLHVDAFH
jgi:hypothetical protein